MWFMSSGVLLNTTQLAFKVGNGEALTYSVCRLLWIIHAAGFMLSAWNHWTHRWVETRRIDSCKLASLGFSTSLTLWIMLACLCLTPLLLVSCPGMPDSFATPWIGNFQAGILEWVAISFLQGIFPTQGSNPCLQPDSPALQADSLPLSR